MMQRDGPETKQMQEKKTSYEATIIGEKRMKWKKKKIPLPDAECPFSFF